MTRPRNAVPLDATVPTAFARLLGDHCRDFPEARGVVEAAGLAEPINAQPLDPYPADVFCHLLEQAASLLDDRQLGLRLGERFRATSLGAVGYVLMTSDNLGDALLRLQTHQPSVHATNPLRITADTGHIVLRWESRHGRLGDLFEEFGAAALVSSIRRLTGVDTCVSRVDLLSRAPRDRAPYEAFFKADLHFGRACLRIDIPVSLLGRPFQGADPVLRSLLEHQLGQRGGRPAGKPSFGIESTLRREMVRKIYAGSTRIEAIAAGMRMHDRKLRTTLHAQGKSFRGIAADVRRQLAEMHLRDHSLQIHEVGELLGYSEQSAFTRAFKRWTGRSPRAFRAALIDAAQT